MGYQPLFYKEDDDKKKKYTYEPPVQVSVPVSTTPVVTTPEPQKTGFLGFLNKFLPQVEAPASKMDFQNHDNDIKGNGFWEKIRTVEDNAGNNLKASPLYNSVANSLPVKAINRAAYSAANTMTGGGAIGSNPDLGNVGNFIADTTGFGFGMGMRNPGLNGTSINSALSPIGNVAEKGVTKGLTKLSPSLPNAVNKTANYVLPTAAKGAAEFGLYGGASNAVQGQSIGEGIKEGAISGALFNVGGKALGSAVKGASKIDTSKINLQPFNNKVAAKGVVTPFPTEIKTGNEMNPSIGATDRVHSIQQVVSSGENADKLNLLDRTKNKASDLYTHYVDINNPIKKVDENTYIAATNSKKVGGTVSHIINDNLVDMQGNKIGESLKSIAKDIPSNEKSDFMNYVLQKHNIDRAREGKPVYADFTPEESQKAIALIEQKHPEYKDLNSRLTGFVNKFMDEWGNKSGLVSDDLWKSLQDTYKNYVPTQREFSTLEQGIQKTNGKGFVDQGKPISKATGSDRDIIDPMENIMNLVNRTVRTARYNEVGQNLLQAIRKDPVGMAKKAEIIPDKVEVNPNAGNIVSVLENGNPVNIQINDKALLDSLKSVNKNAELNNLGKAAKNVNAVYKGLITQKNPFFALRNVARDIPTAYVNGSEKNPIVFLGDLMKAGKDIATNSENVQKYRALGGEASNFFSSDKSAQAVKDLTSKPNIFKKALNGIEKFNNVTETAPRLAEFNRSLKKGETPQQALYKAGEVTTNFSRGGDVTKSVDTYVPYLNASVQGLDKMARQVKNNPVGTLTKGAISVTAPTLVFNYLNKDNEKYKELDNRTKDNYYLIPNGDTFIKIPKSRELGVLFGSLAERTLRAISGEKNAFKGFGSTVGTNFSPTNPIENNILSPIAYNLPANKDFAGRTIVSQSVSGRSASLQYDDTTSEIGKKIGELTGLSPKQVDYVIKSYTGVLGQIGLPASTAKTYQGDSQGNLLKPLTTQFTADPLYSNQALTDFYDNKDAASKAAADKNFLGNIDSKVTTHEEYINSAFTKASKDISDLTKQVNDANKAGDLEKVKALRQQIIDIAKETNKIMNGIPSAEVKGQIEEQIKYNTSDRATSIRKKAQQISDSNRSEADKTELLQTLQSTLGNMKQGKPPKKKKNTLNPFDN